jgi:cbb3-type cytochrome oxidase subunit 3
MNVLHNLFMGMAYVAGMIALLIIILGGIGFLIAAVTKKK